MISSSSRETRLRCAVGLHASLSDHRTTPKICPLVVMSSGAGLRPFWRPTVPKTLSFSIPLRNFPQSRSSMHGICPTVVYWTRYYASRPCSATTAAPGIVVCAPIHSRCCRAALQLSLCLKRRVSVHALKPKTTKASISGRVRFAAIPCGNRAPVMAPRQPRRPRKCHPVRMRLWCPP